MGSSPVLVTTHLEIKSQCLHMISADMISEPPGLQRMDSSVDLMGVHIAFVIKVV